MNNNITDTAFHAKLIRAGFRERSITVLEANLVESVFRRGKEPGDSPSVEVLIELLELHALAGNRDRALAIADEIAGRSNLDY